ncbi:hypothetical protein GA0115246_1089513 [Streptomyces sp. SolWspMP-sol7th]|nr:hypothetical protein GA0115246_1089513 [Streptomyces sp. SolWspMP-sol7th]
MSNAANWRASGSSFFASAFAEAGSAAFAVLALFAALMTVAACGAGVAACEAGAAVRAIPAALPTRAAPVRTCLGTRARRRAAAGKGMRTEET